jgi:hypothetical protein
MANTVLQTILKDIEAGLDLGGEIVGTFNGPLGGILTEVGALLGKLDAQPTVTQQTKSELTTATTALMVIKTTPAAPSS